LLLIIEIVLYDTTFHVSKGHLRILNAYSLTFWCASHYLCWWSIAALWQILRL
jgi:hypothetical protein